MVNLKSVRGCVEDLKPFKGSSVFGVMEDGVYKVFSYGRHWPILVNKDGRWFENTDKRSKTTSRHLTACRPFCQTIGVDLEKIRQLAN